MRASCGVSCLGICTHDAFGGLVLVLGPGVCVQCWERRGDGGSVGAWYTPAVDIEEVLSGAVDSHAHVCVADVIKSVDTVDGRILDRVLRSLGLAAWFRHAYFEYIMRMCVCVSLPWTRNGGIPKGCPLSMMFIVACTCLL